MKTILISGSSSGIGRAIAESQLAVGNRVIGLARDHRKFTPETENYISYSVDFSKISTLEKELREISKTHRDINHIIGCAGYGEFAELEQLSVTNMQRVMNVNFLSQVVLVKTFLPFLKQKQSGKIIFIGSECALEGQKKGSIYCASKFALRGFAQSLRKECVSAQIGVTMINPGLVDTPFFTELNFKPAEGETHAIQAAQIAEVVALVINQESNLVCEEINLQPMKKVVVKIPLTEHDNMTTFA